MKKRGYGVLPENMADVPMPKVRQTNSPPDVTLDLTHEQATFLVKNCDANTRLCLAIIVSIQHEKVDIEIKRAKAEKIVAMQEKFNEIRKLLLKAGAVREEDE